MLDKFRKEHLAFLITLGLLSCFAIVSALVISTPYTFDVVKNLSGKDLLSGNMEFLFGLSGFFLLMIITAVIAFKNKISNLVRNSPTFFNNIISSKLAGNFFLVSVAVILIIYVIYNYFIRPSGTFNSDSFNLVKLSWYTAGLIGISATVIGILVLIRKRPCWNQLVFLSIFGIFAVYQILYSNISPDQPWWVRRYLPVVIPSMVICMGCCITWLWSSELFKGKYTVLGRWHCHHIIDTYYCTSGNI